MKVRQDIPDSRQDRTEIRVVERYTTEKTNRPNRLDQLDEMRFRKLMLLLRKSYNDNFSNYMLNHNMEEIRLSLDSICEGESVKNSVYYFRIKYIAKFNGNYLVEVFRAELIKHFEEILRINDDLVDCCFGV